MLFTETVLATNLEYPTRAPQSKKPTLGAIVTVLKLPSQTNQTTDPEIVMSECYQSSQRVNSMTKVVITPVHLTHTRLHKLV